MAQLTRHMAMQVTFLSFALVGCSGTSDDSAAPNGTGGSAASGSTSSVGGTRAVGGASSVTPIGGTTGSSLVEGVAGVTSVGGANSSSAAGGAAFGGEPGSGGTSTGGTTAKGGSSSTGGTTAKGGGACGTGVPGTTVGKAVAEFTLTNRKNAPFSYSSFCGSVTVVQCGGLWCGNCAGALGDVDGLMKKYQSQGFHYLAIEAEGATSGSQAPTAAQLDTYMREDISPPLPDTPEVQAVADPDGTICNKYAIGASVGFPNFMIVDKSGIIDSFDKEGWDLATLENAIRAALAKP